MNVALYINGQRIVGRATNVWINNNKVFKNSDGIGKRSNVSYDSTSFVLPTEKILPSGEAVINSLKIYNRDLSADEVKSLYQSNVLVEFESNGGSNIKSIKPGAGKTFTAPTNPTRPGYAFIGWYKDNTLNDKWDFENNTIDSDITLYVKWEKVELNLESLKELITTANKLDSNLYTTDSFNNVITALNDAERLLDAATQKPDSVSQEEINIAYDKLNTAINNLQIKQHY